MRTGIPDLLLLIGRFFETTAAGDRSRDCGIQPGRFQFLGRSAKNRLRRLKAFEQQPDSPGAQTWHHP
jgi:hypothetical protein